MSDTWSIVIGLAAVVVLVAINGLFVATEFAFVAVRRTRVEQLVAQGQARARLLDRALRNLDQYIAATQLGITMASLGLGWVGEPALGRVIQPPIEQAVGSLGAEAISHTVAFIVAFALITVVLIVFGELAPKTIALHHAERIALVVAPPLAVFNRVFLPVTLGMNKLGRLVVRPLGLRTARGHTRSLDTDELELEIEASARAGLLSRSELLLARRALEFGEIPANRIMVPRTEVIAIEVGDPLDEVVALALRHGHARYPVYEGTLDRVVGMLEVKSLLRLVRDGKREWRPLVRDAVFVPESIAVEGAVQAMRDRQVQIVVLADEHGGTAGILTGDEVLYRLLGRWRGVRDAPRGVRPRPEGELRLSGLTLIADVEEAIGADLAGDEYDTVGGFMMARLGRIPRAGDVVEAEGHRFRVLGMDGKRVDRVEITGPGTKQDAGAD
jgi:CBS domain containing-hemolysin-like protein